jgi:hypothetical protein
MLIVIAGEQAAREKLSQIRKALPIFRRWAISDASLSRKSRRINASPLTLTNRQ